jgi:hypothetical protein
VDIAFDAPRDHFAIAVVARGKIDQRRNLQRLLLHQTEHGGRLLKKDNGVAGVCNTPQRPALSLTLWRSSVLIAMDFLGPCACVDNTAHVYIE